MKRAIVSVISDLVTDQRVHRTCITLSENGYDVLLIGRRTRSSLPLPPRSYIAKRMKLFFEKGVPFYAEFQLRLLPNILFRKADLLFSNDLDTLLPNFIVSNLKKVPLLYDSHEYFTGVPELQNHPLKKGIWKMLERLLIPRLKYMFTVNNSIATLYHDEFGVKVQTLRNCPVTRNITSVKTRKELGIPEDLNIILLQGAGINVERGAEEAIEAMRYINNALLIIIGGGDALEDLKKLPKQYSVDTKVRFIPKLPFEELIQYTMLADIGLTLDKGNNINYKNSLPNKLFDYIHAGVPILASSLPEVKKIIEEYNVGTIVDSHEPLKIAEKINSMLNDKDKLAFWKNNCLKAKESLCWEKEKKVLEYVLEKL